MAYLVGIILGDMLSRIELFKALRAALLLGGGSLVAYRLAVANGAPQIAVAVAIALPAALFIWAALNPTQSERRFEIYEGVYLILRLAMWLLVIAIILGLLSVGFHLSIWLRRESSWLALAAIIWGAQRLMDMQLIRSHHRMGEQSVMRA